MDLIYRLLLQGLISEKAEILFPQLEKDIPLYLESESYKMLREIKSILEDDSVSDPSCFLKIEEIIQVFESRGIGCGNRHDFG